MTRAGVAQVEEEEKDPLCDAELAVVLWVTVPLIVAVVPDAELLKLKLADPAPPATASSSVSLSSIRISAIRLSLLMIMNDGAAWLSAIRAWSLRADVVRTQPLHPFQTLVRAWRSHARPGPTRVHNRSAMNNVSLACRGPAGQGFISMSDRLQGADLLLIGP
jgi:hypothetical protein